MDMVVTAIRAIDAVLFEECASREGRRVAMALHTALHTARLTPVKTPESFDFSFQPSPERNRVMALAEFEFIDRAEVLHLIGPPGVGKSHLAGPRRDRVQGTV